MRVKSPVGEYEYRVTGVHLEGGSVEIAGSLGEWETTMVIEPSDVAAWARRAAPALAGVAAILALRRLARR